MGGQNQGAMVEGMRTAHIISMARCFDRREHIVNQMSEHGWPYVILEGVDGIAGDADGYDHDPGLFMARWNRRMKKGDLGTYVSHLRAMEYILSTGEDYGMIVEDDIIVLRDQEPLLNLSTDFDVCYVCSPLMHNTSKVLRRELDHDVLAMAPIGTQGYCVSRRFAMEFLERFGVCSAPIDEELRELSMTQEFKWVVLRDFIMRPDWTIPTTVTS